MVAIEGADVTPTVEAIWPRNLPELDMKKPALSASSRGKRAGASAAALVVAWARRTSYDVRGAILRLVYLTTLHNANVERIAIVRASLPYRVDQLQKPTPYIVPEYTLIATQVRTRWQL